MMKEIKRLINLAVVLLTAAEMTWPIFAYTNTYVIDNGDEISDADEQQITDEAGRIDQQDGLYIMTVTDHTYTSSYQLAEDTAADEKSAENVIVLAFTRENVTIYPSGTHAEEIFTDDVLDKMYNAIANETSVGSASLTLITQAGLIYEQGGYSTSAAVTSARLVDEANLLTDAQKTQLTAKLDEISKRQGLDVVIVTVGSLGGKTAQTYADDFYDNGGYGKDGVLLLLASNDRYWAVSTSGYGITAFTDYGIDQLMSSVTPSLSSKDYNGGFTTFADLADQYITKARNGQPVDTTTSAPAKKGISPLAVPASLGIGALVGIAAMMIEKSKMKSVVQQQEAISYLDRQSVRLTNQQDIFLFTHVARIPRPQQPPAGGGQPGGSTTHISSGGHVHGGRSGRF